MKIEVRSDGGEFLPLGRIGLRVSQAVQDSQARFGVTASTLLVRPELYALLQPQIKDGEFWGCRVVPESRIDMEAILV